MSRAMRLPVILCIAVFATIVACSGSDDNGTDPPEETGIFGAYTLQSVNGNDPPAIYYVDASIRIMLDSGTLRLSTNGAYSDSRAQRRIDIMGEVKTTNTRTGTWTSTPTSVTLSFTNDLGIPSTATLPLNGKVLSLTEGNVNLVWSK